MKIGYIGITPYSKREDKEVNQESLLEGCEKLINEKATWFSAEKMSLIPLVNSLKEGDKLVVCSLRFLAQDITQLITIIERIENAGATLTVLDLGANLSCKFKALKEFESYVKSAKIKKGKSKSNAIQGRKPLSNAIILQVNNDKKFNPKMTITEIAQRAGISRRSVNRILNNEEN